MPYRVATNALSAVNGSYAREALLNGLAIERAGGENPYKFGFIGSSDTHSGAAAIEEDNYVSKLGLLSSEAVQRGSVPYTGLDAQTFYWGSRVLAVTNPSPRGGAGYSKINGEVYINGATPTFGASGLAAAGRKRTPEIHCMPRSDEKRYSQPQVRVFKYVSSPELNSRSR